MTVADTGGVLWVLKNTPEAVIVLQPTVRVPALGSGLAYKLKWVWFRRVGVVSKNFRVLHVQIT